MKQLTVLFFAVLKEKAGTTRVEIDLPDQATVGELKLYLSNLYPNIGPSLETAIVAINYEFVTDNETISDHSEIAIFPPVSGGIEFPTIYKITTEELDLNMLVADITSNSTGAVCIFTGIVRGETRRDNPHETVRLEYEAYIPMAEQKMAQVAREIRDRWPSIEGIEIVQRIGKLDPKTPTVLIACSAAHRDTGVFDAARYGIDRLKEIVPIWKKEITPDGDVWIEGEYYPSTED